MLVLLRSAADPQPVIADGVWRGEFIDDARGEGGFGYDPLMYIDALGATVAQLDAAGHLGRKTGRGVYTY